MLQPRADFISVLEALYAPEADPRHWARGFTSAQWPTPSVFRKAPCRAS